MTLPGETSTSEDQTSAETSTEQQQKQEKSGFIDQEWLDNLSVTIKEEEIKIFSNPRFLAVLHQQAVDAKQAECVNFLRDIYSINQSKLTPEGLKAMTDRVMKKYFTQPEEKSDGDDPNNKLKRSVSYINENELEANPDYVNVGTGLLDKIKQGIREGALLVSFVPVIDEAVRLVNTNIDRPITGFDGKPGVSKEKVKQQLLEAYHQDKQDQLLLPVRSVICEALDGLKDALSKIDTLQLELTPAEKRLTPEYTERVDIMVTLSKEHAKKIHGELLEILKESTKPDASLSNIQKKLETVLVDKKTFEDNIKCLNRVHGTKSSRSTKIGTLLKPLETAAKICDILTSSPNLIRDPEDRARKKSLKESTLLYFQTESNKIKVAAYVEKARRLSESTPPPSPPLPRKATLSGWTESFRKK